MRFGNVSAGNVYTAQDFLDMGLAKNMAEAQNMAATQGSGRATTMSQSSAANLTASGGGMTAANFTQGKLDDQKKMFLMIGGGVAVVIILIVVLSLSKRV